MPGLTEELPITFGGGAGDLVGVLHRPSPAPRVGVVVVVGGPQYRVGSHRQFVLLARELAAHGIAALRFDCTGMGDSDGEFPGFERIESDIAAAVGALVTQVPSVERIVLWGLCDAASAIAFSAHSDPRIAGVVLLNPWVRTEAGAARAYLKHYYLQRLVDPTFLHKVARGQFDAPGALRSLASMSARAIGIRSDGGKPEVGEAVPSGDLAERMAIGLQNYRGPVLLIISGRDLTAKEFVDAARGSKRWRRLFQQLRILQRDLPEADHTFSRRTWRDQIAAWTLDWMKDRIAR